MDTGIFSAALTVAAGLVLASIAYGLIRWLKQQAKATPTLLDDIVLMAVGTPVVIAIIVVSFYFALTRYDIVPVSMAGIRSGQVIDAVFVLLGAWIASSFFHNLIRTYGSEIAGKTDMDLNRLVPLLLVVVRYLIWFVAFLLILAVFQIDITVFLAGAGIAGIALALAAQDVLSNFLGGAIIAIDKPFRIGDRVKIDTFMGDVVFIGGRSTRIKTLDNRIITIPNSTVTKNVVINYSQPDPSLKLTIPFSVSYSSDMDRVTEILLAIAREAAEKTPWVMTDPAPVVYFHEIGESALNGQLLLWTNNYDNDRDVLNWVNRQIVRQFRDEKIEMPFRQVDVWMRKGGSS